MIEYLYWFVLINWALPFHLASFWILFAWLGLRDYRFQGFVGPFLRFTVIEGGYGHTATVYWKDPSGNKSGYYMVHELHGVDELELGEILPTRSYSFTVPMHETNPVEPWHAKMWKGWWGVALHIAVVHRDRPDKFSEELVARNIKHEQTHLYQQLLGTMFWVIYFAHMGWIVATQKLSYVLRKMNYRRTLGTTYLSEVEYPYEKHAYLDCIWERQARKRAGQEVDIPPERWPQGPKDLFPWA